MDTLPIALPAWTPIRQRGQPSCTVLPVDDVHAKASSPDAGNVTAADLTLRQAAELAGCSVKTLRRAIHTGELPSRYASTAHGAQFILPYADVERWIGQRQAAAVHTAPPPTVDTSMDTSAPLDNPMSTVQKGSYGVSQGLDTSTLVQPLLQQIVAPLTAEIARLNELTRTQAEELGALRERVRVYETAQLTERQQPHAQAAPDDEPAPAALPSVTPKPRSIAGQLAHWVLRHVS